MSANSSSAFSGVFDILRLVGDGLYASVQGRLELLSIELQEEKFRIVQTFIWIGIASTAGMLALLFLSLLLVYSLHDEARLVALVALAAFYTAAGVGSIVALKCLLSRHPRPFSATLDEIARDRRCIRRES